MPDHSAQPAIAADNILLIDDYIGQAMKKSGFTSERQLAAALKISSGNISRWRKGHSMPSDGIMARLADLAHTDPAEAVIWLNFWRTQSWAKPLYLEVIARLRSASVALAAFAMLSQSVPWGPADASVMRADPPSVYYGK